MRINKVMFVAIVILSLGLLQVVSAEGPLMVGIEGNVAVPMGDFGDAAKTGLGGTAFVEYMATPNMSLSGKAGYLYFGGESEGFSFSAVPILAEGRYYMGMQGEMRPFLGAQLGVHIFSFKTEFNNPITGEKMEESTSETKFSFAPTIGIRVNQLDISAFYMLISDDPSSLNYVGFRIGFGFPMGS
ncbi:MAG: hypothetical protein WAN36_00650 [Calditrichia bacterium]